jgi:hypothetical protein
MERTMKTNNPTHRSDTTTVQRKPRKNHWLKLNAELAFRLEALCKLQPGRTRDQVANELLSWALTEHEPARSMANPEAGSVQADGTQPIYLPVGAFAEFRGLSVKHHLAMEHELDRIDRQESPPANGRSLADPD